MPLSARSRTTLTGVASIALLLLTGCPEPRPTPAAAALPDVPTIRVLGTAQDGGLPHASCSCVRCESARSDPGARRLVASLALILPEGDVHLFDATPDIREQLDLLRDLTEAPGKVDRAPLSGVWLTHAHIGHYTGLSFFGFEAMHTDRLPVYATRKMAAFLRQNGPWSQLVELGNISLRELEPGDPVPLGSGVSVAAISVPHRDEYTDTIGFVIQGRDVRLLYVPDTDAWNAWQPEFTEVLDDIDIALVDATFYSLDELPGRDLSAIPHPLIADTMDLLESRVRAGDLQVYFTHLNHSNPALAPHGPQLREIEKRGFHVLPEGHQFPLEHRPASN